MPPTDACVHIKVAKLRTGVGSAEMSHLQNCSVKIFKSTAGILQKNNNNNLKKNK